MYDTWLTQLLTKHSRKGVIVDANILFVYCVGLLDQSLVSKVKGTKEYTLGDFRLFNQLIANLGLVITTPNILTEVSNLACRLRNDIQELIHVLIKVQFVASIEERYVASNQAIINPIFTRLGLSDTAIATLAEEGLLVLTNDLGLALYLESRNIDCIHYDRSLRPLVFDERDGK